MFTILMKDVDGRRSFRYFGSWANAERAMMDDVAAVKKLVTVILESHIDRMNVEKGFYEREETIIASGGTRFHYALLDGYFEDE